MKIFNTILISAMHIIFSENAFALPEETNLCIYNTTNQSHYIQTTDIENYDWNDDRRPDKNFNNIIIQAGEKICRREEKNAYANDIYFTFVIDGNPTRVAFKGTYKLSGNRHEGFLWGAYTNSSNPTTLYGKNTIWWQDSNWWAGYSCSGNSCSVLELR